MDMSHAPSRRSHRSTLYTRSSRSEQGTNTDPPAEARDQQHEENRQRLDRLDRLNRAISQLNREYDTDLMVQREILQQVEAEARAAESDTERERNLRLHADRLRDLRTREHHNRVRRETLQRMGLFSVHETEQERLMRVVARHVTTQTSDTEVGAERDRLIVDERERADRLDERDRARLRALTRLFGEREALSRLYGERETSTENEERGESFTRTRRPASSALFDHGRLSAMMAKERERDSQSTRRLLQDTIAYLANLRNMAASFEECRMFATLAGLEDQVIESKAFVWDLNAIQKPQETSLLLSGSIFSGEQFANHALETSSIFTTTRQSSSSSSQHGGGGYESSSLAPTMGPPSRYSFRRGSLQQQQQQPPPPPPQSQPDVTVENVRTPSSSCDKWPVTVRIYDVDWEKMTLSAAMEAYDVPSHPSTGAGCNPAAHHLKSITTYLEGEIVDFRIHSLLTENFNSCLVRDASYWRKLAPFASIPSSELPNKLLSPEFLDQVTSKYMLMRWKEKCFVHSTGTNNNNNNNNNGSNGNGESYHPSQECVMESDGCGLTISGFYYVSLRRADGHVEGLYCDAQNSPFQYLRLGRKVSSAFVGWEFA